MVLEVRKMVTTGGYCMKGVQGQFCGCRFLKSGLIHLLVMHF